MAAAFVGALGGVLLTLGLARGALQTLRLLLAGAVVAVLLGALTDLVTVVSRDALRGKQAFMLGSTSYLGWPAPVLMAAATALAVSQAGLVAFVGLVAPHLVRRHAPGAHAWLLGASAAMAAVLLGVADVVSRALIPPQELPVGVVTAALGGLHLFVLLRQRGLS